MLKGSLKIVVVAIVAVLMVVAGDCFAEVGGYVELQRIVADDSELPPQGQIALHLEAPINEEFSWSAYSSNSKKRGETYVGLIYVPIDWFEISGNLGVETARDPLRKALTLWFGDECWSISSVNEDGGSGFWCDDIAMIKWNDFFSTGLRAQTGLGAGLHAESLLFNQNFNLSGTYFVGADKNYLLISWRMLF